MSILDLSNTLMYDFHYNYMKQKYGDNAILCFTDTDSLKYLIQTEDFYKDISVDVKDKLDTSNYPPNHPSGILSGRNKKVLGMMKDEAGGEIIDEFVGLRAKLYSKIFKNTRGLKNQWSKSISHEDYKKCLFSRNEQLRKMNIIRSHKHEIYTEEINKVALSPHDDKRHILEYGVHTLALGHYRLS